MKHPNNSTARSPILCAALVGCLVVVVLVLEPAAWTAVAPEPTAGAMALQRAPRQAAPKVSLDEFPPDFELPLLTFGKNKEGTPIGIISDTQTFRLSSFRGKRPVCMIMSSYT